MYERSELLCYMLGWMERDKKPIKREDSLILLDQILSNMNQQPVTKEEKEILKQASEEMGIFLIQMGINRKNARRVAKVGHL